MMDFKLNMYFEMYKDLPLPNRDEFRRRFKKKHGNFIYLNQLILDIERYQLKKYGTTLSNYIKDMTKEERKRANRNEKQRLRRRLK